MGHTNTPNLNLIKPDHKDPDSYNTWDTGENDNKDKIDAAIGARSYAGGGVGRTGGDGYSGLTNDEPLSTSINKVDRALKAVSVLAPSSDQMDALAGAGTPDAGNPYATKDYVDGLTVFTRKLVLFPEFAGATFTEGAGSDHAGDFTTDVEANGNYLYNFYKWLGTAGALNQYDIVCQFRIPESFVSLATSKAIVIDLCTQENTTTNNKVDVTISVDGSATTPVAVTGKKSATAATWTSERESSSVAYFDASDLSTLSLIAGSTVNVRITMYSNNKYVKIGAITFQYSR